MYGHARLFAFQYSFARVELNANKEASQGNNTCSRLHLSTIIFKTTFRCPHDTIIRSKYNIQQITRISMFKFKFLVGLFAPGISGQAHGLIR